MEDTWRVDTAHSIVAGSHAALTNSGSHITNGTRANELRRETVGRRTVMGRSGGRGQCRAVAPGARAGGGGDAHVFPTSAADDGADVLIEQVEIEPGERQRVPGERPALVAVVASGESRRW